MTVGVAAELSAQDTDCYYCHQSETSPEDSDSDSGSDCLYCHEQELEEDSKPECGFWPGYLECYSYTTGGCGGIEFAIAWLSGNAELCREETYTWYWR